MEKLNPFHLAIPVTDIEESKRFYHNLLGAKIGRFSDTWIDFDFFGHQLVCHLSPASISEISNPVDQEDVPVPHYGVVLDWKKFKAIIKQLEEKKINFIIKPTIRFKGEVGEQAIAFLRDPSGNAIEFKSFRNMDNLFKAE
jgi:extradiol dioxygenase family protein|tara:strand:- start:1314 stop:1736 length:423 start_codon:yes stop_codon:yes gene_type:complete